MSAIPPNREIIPRRPDCLAGLTEYSSNGAFRSSLGPEAAFANDRKVWPEQRIVSTCPRVGPISLSLSELQSGAQYDEIKPEEIQYDEIKPEEILS